MKKVNFNSIMESAYNQYINSSKTTLYHCYNSFSNAKYNAYEYCLKLFTQYNGNNFRIINYNSNIFTAGFIYKDNFNHKHFVYITPSYDRDCIID